MWWCLSVRLLLGVSCDLGLRVGFIVFIAAKFGFSLDLGFSCT